MTRFVELRDPGEQFVEVQYRCDIASDLGESFERFGILPAPLEQLRIDDSDRNVRGELGRDRDVAHRELIAVLAEDVQGADGPGLVQERNDELRLHARRELDVPGVGRDVVHEERLLRLHGGPDQAHARAQPHGALRLGIANRVGQAQISTALVPKVDGKCFERNEPADQPRNLSKELIEVENGRHLAAEIEQRDDKLVFAWV